MLHTLAHIELNAVDLAWDSVVRYSYLGLDRQFYDDFARVADEESRHYGWCHQRLAELGHTYGDMDAHDLLWQGAGEARAAGPAFAAAADCCQARLDPEPPSPLQRQAAGTCAGGWRLSRSPRRHGG